MNTLANRVKERMDALSISNVQLSRLCGVRPPTSYNWANGKTKSIKGEPLLRAAKALGVTPEWLATGMGRKFLDNASPAIPLERNEVISYLPAPREDKMVTELLLLFSQLDEAGKREYLAHLRGFVAGRHPYQDGQAPVVAGK